MTVFSETLTVNLRFHDFWGYQKLKTKGGFHWNQGYSTEKEGRWISLKPRVFNWEGGWVVFIETKGIRLRRKAFGLLLSRNPWFQWNHPTSFSVETLGFNETTCPPSQSKPLVSMKPPLVSISEPPKNRETADILLKFHWNRQKKKWGFLLKPTYSLDWRKLCFLFSDFFFPILFFFEGKV